MALETTKPCMELLIKTGEVIKKVSEMDIDYGTMLRALGRIGETALAAKLYLGALYEQGFDIGDRILHWDPELYSENENYRGGLDGFHRQYLKMLMIPVELERGTFDDYERIVLSR
jgi:hypothetical protein